MALYLRIEMYSIDLFAHPIPTAFLSMGIEKKNPGFDKTCLTNSLEILGRADYS
jgi:hypothetical protein